MLDLVERHRDRVDVRAIAPTVQWVAFERQHAHDGRQHVGLVIPRV